MSFEPLDYVRHILDELAYLRGAGAQRALEPLLDDRNR